MIIFVLGDSGVGKDTIVDMLIDIIGEDKAYKIRSWTTRKPRYKGEDTHTFVWWPGSTHSERLDAFRKDFLFSKRLFTYSRIDGEYYWTEKKQLGHKEYEFYIIDTPGLKRCENRINNGEYMVLEIRRPPNLIDIDEERKHRNVFHNYECQDLIFHNIATDKNTLKEHVKDLAEVIKNFNK